MAEVKNYNRCPLKKRPVLYVKEEEEREILCEPQLDQDEPVNLCVKKSNHEEQSVPVNYSKPIVSRPSPLTEITGNHQDGIRAAIKVEDPYVQRIMAVPSDALYNLLPGYAANHSRDIHYSQTSSGHSPIASIKKEPCWSYAREPSMSPPSSHSQVFAPVKIIPSPPHTYQPDYYYPAETVHKTESSYANANSGSSKHRYMPYHLSRQHHIVDQYQTTASPAHSHSSLNSVGSPRNSMSPASTSSSLTEDSYHAIPIAKSMAYESMAPFDHHHQPTNKTEVPRYQCSDCAKSYSTHSGLNKHKQFHCIASGNSQAKKTFNCSFCAKAYTSLGALKMHIRTHTKPCKCHLCGKAFSRPWLLNGHIRTHTGDKPFSCQFCHRAFADKSNLRAHLQTHSDVKKYSCASCSKTFSRMSLLAKHSDGGCPGTHDHRMLHD